MIEKAFLVDNHWGGGDYSVTELIAPSYQTWMRKHKGEITQTAEDVAQMVFGTALHEYLEKNVHEPFILKEVHMTKEVDFDIDESYNITGTADFFMWYEGSGQWVVGDYKTKGGYSLKKFVDGETDDVQKQLSIYRWMMQDKMSVSKFGEVITFGYGDIRGQNRIQYHPVTLMSIEETDKWVRERIKRLQTQPEMDCEAWRCGYCSANCPKNKKL